MRTNLYDVYDAEGKCIIENKTAKEVSAILDIPALAVTRSACKGHKLRGIYPIVKVGELANSEDNTVKEYLLEEWDKIVSPFKNIIWVKEYEPGVKRLTIK